jgi:hypothetical protein
VIRRPGDVDKGDGLRYSHKASTDRIMKKVTRRDWGSWKPARALRRVPCGFAFTEDQYRLIERGRISSNFDEPWNVIEEKGVVSFYHSRTATLVYEAHFDRAGEYRLVREISATTDLEIYSVPEHDLDVAADVWNVVDLFLLRSPSQPKGWAKPLDRYEPLALTFEKLGLAPQPAADRPRASAWSRFFKKS